MQKGKYSSYPALALTVLIAVLITISAGITAQENANERIGGFLLGPQAYSFRLFTFFEAIDKTKQLGCHVIEAYPGQPLSPQDKTPFGHNASPETLAKVKAKLTQDQVRLVNYGVVELDKSEAEARKVFEFAKAMTIPAITTEPPERTPEQAMDMIERLVKEYDIKVGIHNHPKRSNDPNYKNWDPNYVLSLVKNRDPRIGSTADTGHWVRSGIKPVDALKILEGRIISSHLKDLNKFEPEAHDVPYGTGVSDIKGILDELRRQNFQGNLSMEYEYHWKNSLPELAQCVEYVRNYGKEH